MNCFIDYRTTLEEINNLIRLGIKPIKIPKTNLVYEAINGHVDIQLNILNKDERKIIVHKDMSYDFLKTLESENISYVLSDSCLKHSYPDDIILNALITDEYFIHAIKYSDKNLLSSIEGKKIINVKQGYTKCSVLPISNKAFITSDTGLYKILKAENLDVLLVPFGDIVLPFMNYGFIGGVGGMIYPDTLAIFGDINEYKYSSLVIDFLNEHKVKVVSLKSGKLVDRGSLFVI